MTSLSNQDMEDAISGSRNENADTHSIHSNSNSNLNSNNNTSKNILPVIGMSPTSEATTTTSAANVTASLVNDSQPILENKDQSIANTNNDDNEEEQEEEDLTIRASNFSSHPVTSIQSQPGVKFKPNEELKASFTGVSNKNTDPISMVLPDSEQSIQESDESPTKNVINGIVNMFNVNTNNINNKEQSDKVSNKKKPVIKTSPLLSSTPPTVSKSLIKAYPFLIILLKVLNVLTWNSDSNHLSIFLVLFSTFSILYYKPIIIYLGHLLPVFSLWIYSESKSFIKNEQMNRSTLDDIIQIITLISQRSEILISPIVELDLTAGDLKRLLFTTVFLSPLYVIISFFILPPNKMLLVLSIWILTYHSKWSKVTRALLWKSRSFRLLCFYLTGLDFENSGLSKTSTLFNLNKKLSDRFKKEKNGKNNLSGLNSSNIGSNSKSSIRFTYVIYENQRRWLGVGWTPNLLSYERTPWTDEFLNESESIENYQLPQLPLSIDLQDNDTSFSNGNNKLESTSINTKGMIWRWIDKTWRLDLTNDSSIQLSSTKPKTTANPKSDDGWIYYDNTWKNPTTEDGFSKYTRRRRWIRTAELVYIGGDDDDDDIEEEDDDEDDEKVEKIKVSNNLLHNESLKSDRKTVSFDSSSQSESDDHKAANKKDKKSKKIGKGGMKKDSKPVTNENSYANDSNVSNTEKNGVKKRKSLRFEDPVVEE